MSEGLNENSEEKHTIIAELLVSIFSDFNQTMMMFPIEKINL